MSGELFAPHGPAPLRFSVTLPLSASDPAVHWAAETEAEDGAAPLVDSAVTASASAPDPRSPAPARRTPALSFAAPQLHSQWVPAVCDRATATVLLTVTAAPCR